MVFILILGLVSAILMMYALIAQPLVAKSELSSGPSALAPFYKVIIVLVVVVLIFMGKIIDGFADESREIWIVFLKSLSGVSVLTLVVCVVSVFISPNKKVEMIGRLCQLPLLTSLIIICGIFYGFSLFAFSMIILAIQFLICVFTPNRRALDRLECIFAAGQLIITILWLLV